MPAVVYNATFKEKVAARIILRFMLRLRDRREWAARTLQRSYRSLREQRREMEVPGIHGKRAKFHMDCVLEERRRRWQSTRHRLMFLGLIPDLLVCLDDLRMKNQAIKDKAKRQLSPKLRDTGIDYEEVHERITRVKYVLRIIDSCFEWY